MLLTFFLKTKASFRRGASSGTSGTVLFLFALVLLNLGIVNPAAASTTDKVLTNKSSTDHSSSIETSTIQIANVHMSDLTPVSKTAAVYLTLKNTAEHSISLVDVESEVAHHAMFHLSKEIDGVAKMVHIDEMTIESGDELVFKRGGLHIMLMGIDSERLNKAFEISLKFSSGQVARFTVNQGK